MARQRYYVAQVETDLVGERIVACCWGAIGSRRGGHKVYPVADYKEALDRLAAIAAVRVRHGYERI